MPRPYKIGLGTKVRRLICSLVDCIVVIMVSLHFTFHVLQGLIAFCVPAVIISCMNIVFAMASNYISFIIILLFFCLGPVLWFARNAIRKGCDGKGADENTDSEAAKLVKVVKSYRLFFMAVSRFF